MFLNISQPIPTMMLFILRKNVQLAKFQNLPVPSTAVFVIAVLLVLTTIVDGWHFLLCIYGAVAIGLVLAGRLKELKVIYILTENCFSSLAPHVVQIWFAGSVCGSDIGIGLE